MEASTPKKGKKSKRIVNMSVLPGQPLDGSGRICIHLFVQDKDGPFIESHALHEGNEQQPIVAAPTRGRLACDPKRTVAPKVKNNVTTITLRTSDPRAVTCPKCTESDQYKAIMEKLNLEG